ncbi:acyl-CoA-like ligand-binding transcription factor [Nocardia terpenica]|uniref:TetR family transcriptional regulator n=1 Tax=Nocardia terpenica TaxID=455432 RepID=A0A291RFH0_9NOCA|nr:TetR family transcriptional regulator [Nocardia terpenica]ATL65884.1 TetR family transcriptional regulator [Nocardia terpenica]
MGLRERKKERTRRTIRTVAMRLFREQGYAETTVEQIAEAADISPSTFFRYFPSKEQVVIADDLDPILIRAIETQPPELSPLEAFKRGVLEVFDALSREEFEFERQRARLVYSVPELRGVIIQETERSVAMIAELVGRRAGRPADSLEARAFAGAMIGAMMAVIDDGEIALDRMARVIDFLEAGMPL